MREATPHLQPQQHNFTIARRGSQSFGSAKDKSSPAAKSRSNSCSNHETSGETKTDAATTLKKRRPSLLGTRVRYGSKERLQNSCEKHSVVVLGVGGVGKTALVVRFVTGRFLNEYDPTLQMTYEKVMGIGDNTVSLEILDTAGNAEASYIRTAEGFVVVYSITDHYSFEAARQMIKLIKEVRKPEGELHVPILLVGNKRDLRRGRTVSKEEARETAAEYSCSFYETSALTNRNVQVIFYNMVFQVRFTKMSKQKSQSPSGNSTNGFLSSMKSLFHTRRKSLPG